MSEDELSKIIVDTCKQIHIDLGPGLFESAYAEILSYELIQQGLQIGRKQPIPLTWENNTVNLDFYADLIVENKVIIEIKSVEAIAPVHHKQVFTYLKLTGMKLGLLINFNEVLMTNGITKIVNRS